MPRRERKAEFLVAVGCNDEFHSGTSLYLDSMNWMIADWPGAAIHPVEISRFYTTGQYA
jgi:hypothetical protein